MASVLVIGSGGREHALAWKLSQSANVGRIYVSPGNGGTANGKNMSNVALDFHNHNAVANWCKDHSISLVVVGPEDPLSEGIVDDLTTVGVPCFGPNKKAAQMESSKEFAKAFMDRHGIPTARWKSFCTADAAREHILSAPYPALVVKASGLAAGKGVIIAKTREEACVAAESILTDKAFGSAGDVVIVEELLEGEEMSLLCFSDGQTVAPMPPAQDHKRLKDNDEGPNTGGMGAYCPYPLISPSELRNFSRDILQRTVDGLKKEGITYVGVLYAGLILTKNGPRVLEFNCRFGDPETQVIMPLLESDLYTTMLSCIRGQLESNVPRWATSTTVVGVVMAMKGYPGSYQKGKPIKGLDRLGDNEIVFHAGTEETEDGGFVTSGGRVLLVAAVGADLDSTSKKALEAVEKVDIDGIQYRRDIAHKALVKMQSGGGRPVLTYRDSGVDISQGNMLVEAIKPICAGTYRTGVEGSVGGFAGLFDLKAAGFNDPILVSGTDGVGTKLKVAQAFRKNLTIGIDLVAMCVNDILAHAAEPLFFLDYFGCGKLDVDVAAQVVSGIAEGCKQAGCSLIGGETAELPGLYEDGVYDLAGFAVGAVERGAHLPLLDSISEGDVAIGVASSGIHSNGYSLVRKVVERLGLNMYDPAPFNPEKQLGEELLTPTKIYSRTLLPSLQSGHVYACAHITGGGLVENVPRVLPPHLAVSLDATAWNILPVFCWIATSGNVPEEEMLRTFNCGIGVVLIVNKMFADKVVKDLTEMNETVSIIGEIVPRERGAEQVIVNNFTQALHMSAAQIQAPLAKSLVKRKKVGVLISGTGTNLQALIDSTRDPCKNSSAQIVLVVSNVEGVVGLQRAHDAGIKTQVIDHRKYATREEFDNAVHASLVEAGVEIVCLAGFMRILSAEFVGKWKGHLLNVHPSLLPSFKGTHAHRQVLSSGVRISGCTVHLVDEQVDNGAILVQESVPVYPHDTEETLQKRVQQEEHRAFPRALEMLARGDVKLGSDGTLIWKQ